MAFLEFGTSSGLAYRHNFNADMARLLQEEAMINNQKAAAEAKAMKIGEQMKFSSGFTPYHQQNIDRVAAEEIAAIGKLSAENQGNLFANPMVYAQFQKHANRIGNNEYTVHSDATKKEYDKMTTLLAEKPNLMKNKKVQQQLQYWDEFKQNGSYELKDSAGNPTGHKMTDFVFQNPLNDIDLNKVAQEAMSNMPATEINSVRDGRGNVLVSTNVSPEATLKNAYGILSNEDYKSVAEEEFAAQDKAIQEQYRGNVHRWFADVKLAPYKQQTSEVKSDPAFWMRAASGAADKPDVKTVPQLSIAVDQSKVTGSAPLTTGAASYLLAGVDNPKDIVNGRIKATGNYYTNDGTNIQLSGMDVEPIAVTQYDKENDKSSIALWRLIVNVS